MFGKSKDGASPSDSEHAPAPLQQIQSATVTPSSPAKANDEVSSISAGMTVTGKISGKGTVQIYGRVEGEVHASMVIVAKGAEVEGDIVTEDIVVGGRVKGTIHANRVKLNGTAAVEGDIFHRSLSIEENARFEGSSRREDTAGDVPRVPLGRAALQPPLQGHIAPEAAPKINGAPDKRANPA